MQHLQLAACSCCFEINCIIISRDKSAYLCPYLTFAAVAIKYTMWERLWYFVTKIIPTYCEKKMFYWSKKSFEIWGWRSRICKNFEITNNVFSNLTPRSQKCFTSFIGNHANILWNNQYPLQPLCNNNETHSHIRTFFVLQLFSLHLLPIGEV